MNDNSYQQESSVSYYEEQNLMDQIMIIHQKFDDLMKTDEQLFQQMPSQLQELFAELKKFKDLCKNKYECQKELDQNLQQIDYFHNEESEINKQQMDILSKKHQALNLAQRSLTETTQTKDNIIEHLNTQIKTMEYQNSKLQQEYEDQGNLIEELNTKIKTMQEINSRLTQDYQEFNLSQDDIISKLNKQIKTFEDKQIKTFEDENSQFLQKNEDEKIQQIFPNNIRFLEEKCRKQSMQIKDQDDEFQKYQQMQEFETICNYLQIEELTQQVGKDQTKIVEYIEKLKKSQSENEEWRSNFNKLKEERNELKQQLSLCITQTQANNFKKVEDQKLSVYSQQESPQEEKLLKQLTQVQQKYESEKKQFLQTITKQNGQIVRLQKESERNKELQLNNIDSSNTNKNQNEDKIELVLPLKTSLTTQLISPFLQDMIEVIESFMKNFKINWLTIFQQYRKLIVLKKPQDKQAFQEFLVYDTKDYDQLNTESYVRVLQKKLDVMLRVNDNIIRKSLENSNHQIQQLIEYSAQREAKIQMLQQLPQSHKQILIE